MEYTSVTSYFFPLDVMLMSSLHNIMGAYSAFTSVTSGHVIILMQFVNVSSLLELDIWADIIRDIGMGPCCQADC